MNSGKVRALALRAAFIAPLCLLVGATAQADINVPAGAWASLGGGSMDLGCTDLIVSGNYDLGGGTLTGVRHVTVNSGGSLSFGAGGSVALAGNWANSGTITATGGTVSIGDDAGCPAPIATSVISGNTTFHNLGITSSAGKLIQFAAGSVQTVEGALTLTGTGVPLRIESTTPGSVSADLRLVPAGTQNLSNLSVRGMSASGQWLAPGQTNQGSGPVSRWFGDPNAAVAPIPTTSQWTLLIMALALGATAVRQRRAKLENSQEGNRS